ncbi:MAG: hypothetical protein ABIN91_01775 [Mucilaginibacter sp.]|uniref:hypothetical protein n=1 Tax=Mucilaginibacter sp. TaxID=1882438 RepID=UPI003265907F
MIKFNGNVVVFKDTLTKKNKRYDAQELNGFTAQADTSDKNLKPHIKNSLLTGFTRISNRKPMLENSINGLQIRVDTFKVLADSFMVKYAGGHAAPSDRLVHNHKFIRQEIYGSNVCLYKITEKYTTGGHRIDGTMVNYAMMKGNVVNGNVMHDLIIQDKPYLKNSFYLKRKNENQYTLVPQRKKPFKKFAAQYLKDNPQLVLDIEQEKLNYYNIDDIVLRYNNTK